MGLVAGRPAGDPDEIVAGSPERARRRPALKAAGRVVVALAALALVLSAADVGPFDLSVDGPLQGAPREETGPLPLAVTPTGGPSPLTVRNGVAWEPRGDLAADEEFVAAAMARVRDSRPRATRLYFAGRLPDGSRLVMAGTDVMAGMVTTAVHVLRVAPGGPVRSAPVTEGAALSDSQQYLAWAGPGAEGSVVAVALARPGPVRFGFSPRVTFADDGSARRSWRLAYSPDGSVVADLGDTDPLVAVRAQAPGVFGRPMLVRVEPERETSAVLEVAGTEAPRYHGPDPGQLSRALRSGAGAVVDLERATAEVIWSGAPWKQRRLAIVLLTRPDGRRFQAVAGQDGVLGFAAGTRALPVGGDARLPWLLEPFSPQDPTLLLCPTGPGSLLYERDGQADLRIPVKEDGVAALVAPGPTAPSAGGATVTLRDPSGRFLLRTVLPEPGFDDPLALD
ncbi:MAG TPA: hypothetical protein VK640_17675 [Actinomycetes bacterium]|nr:hypothetical protein [Actinomycetes bacterium]